MNPGSDHPADDLEAPPAPAADSPLRFVEGELHRPRLPLFYRLSLILVGMAMVLLPLFYLALAGGCAYGVFRYGVQGAAIFAWRLPGLGGILVKLVCYFGPLLAGAFLTLFLVKPIFAPPPRRRERFSLNHADAPQLFTLLGWICRSLDAPIPSRIDVDCGVNAAAGFRGGLRSLFGNDIVLTIGLPLVAGLNLGQLANVIAHEYGHFSQGAAMRAYYLSCRINHWFWRIVYQRDAWDEALAAAFASGDAGLVAGLLLYAVRLGVGFSRGVAWVFLMFSDLLSSLLSRQMEFNADLYAVRLGGSRTFLETQLRVRQLGLGATAAFQQLVAKWRQERKLFDQIPEFIVSRADEIPAETQGQFYAEVFQRQTRLFDRHPSDAERRQRATEAGEPGIFRPTAPATTLFSDFPGLSRRITLAYYQRVCGPAFSEQSLLSTSEAARATEHDYGADRDIIRDFFLGVEAGLRPISIAENTSPTIRSRETLIDEIRHARRQMRELLTSAREAAAACQHADARLLFAIQAAQLLRAGFTFDPADFDMAGLEVEEVIPEARSALAEANESLRAFRAAGQTRLTCALQLLRRPPLPSSRGPHDSPSPAATTAADILKLQEQAKELGWVLSRLAPVFAPLQELRRDCAALEALLRYSGIQPGAENLAATLAQVCPPIQKHIDAIQKLTAEIRYPFQHATKGVLVSDHARTREYQSNPNTQLLLEAQSHIEKITDLHDRLLAALITIARQAEDQVPE